MGDLQISVPVEPAKYDEFTQTGTFLVSNINVGNYRQITTWIGFASATTFGLMTLWLAYLWGSISRHRQEYQKAFNQVAKVMNKSPIPYLHLDRNDRIHDFNEAFCDLLGYPTTKEAKEDIYDKTFKSLCADEESAAKYDSVQTKRKNKESVLPYSLRLRRFDDSVVSVQVVSADIPSEKRRVLPETFGILLEEKNVKPDLKLASDNVR